MDQSDVSSRQPARPSPWKVSGFMEGPRKVWGLLSLQMKDTCLTTSPLKILLEQAEHMCQLSFAPLPTLSVCVDVFDQNQVSPVMSMWRGDP